MAKLKEGKGEFRRENHNYSIRERRNVFFRERNKKLLNFDRRKGRFSLLSYPLHPDFFHLQRGLALRREK